MTHIVDSVNIDELNEQWFYPKNTLIRIRKIKNNIEFAQIGYFDDSEYYKTCSD